MRMPDSLGDSITPDAARVSRLLRQTLYAPDELLAGWQPGQPYESSLDGSIRGWYEACGGEFPDPGNGLVQRIHDWGITLALAELLASPAGRRAVGVMGGHDTARDDRDYAVAARLGYLLGRRGFLVVTGGGLGIMEAANLGASLAGHADPAVVERALEVLARAPGWNQRQPDAFIAAAREVKRSFQCDHPSLGVPTWAFADEPAGLFATSLAKYFSNSVREDGLLRIANLGVVFAPGGSGTMQEIFQDAAQNVAAQLKRPMVFLGRERWGKAPSVFEVARSEGARYGFGDLVALCDDPAEAVEFVARHAGASAAELEASRGSQETVLAALRSHRRRR